MEVEDTSENLIKFSCDYAKMNKEIVGQKHQRFISNHQPRFLKIREFYDLMIARKLNIRLKRYTPEEVLK